MSSGTLNEQQMIAEYVYWVDPLDNLYPLFGGKRTLLSWTNFGMPDITYLSDKGPFQHGRTVRDYRAQARTIRLEPFERGCSRQSWWDNNRTLIDALRPNRSSTAAAGKLFVIMPDGAEREIPARIQRGPAGNWDYQGSLQPKDLRDSLTFFCEDPFWRDPTETTLVFTVTLINSCLPTCLPLCLTSTSLINASQDITYTGSWNGDQITITLIGPMASPVISNSTTSQQIQMNYTISSGEEVVISIQPNVTTVTNNSGVNLIGTIQDISDLVTFFLATISDLTSTGVNTITVTASGATANTEVKLSYFTRYIGVN